MLSLTILYFYHLLLHIKMKLDRIIWQIFAILLLSLLSHSQLTSINMTYTKAQPQNIIIYNGIWNQQFNGNSINSPFMSCVYSNNLYTMYDIRQQNLLYNLSINVNSTQNITVSIKSQYRVSQPVINITGCNSSSTCSCQSTECNFSIKNQCPNTLLFSKVDLILITIQLNNPTIIYTIQFNLICLGQYNNNIISYGFILIVFVCATVIVLSAIYSEARSLKNLGIAINIPVIIIFDIIIILNGLLLTFVSNYVMDIVYDVISVIITIFSVGICSNQILYLLKIRSIKLELVKFKMVKVRIIDIISLVIGIGVACAWWFLNKNWIVTDAASISIIFAVVKIFKFTSLKSIAICLGTNLIALIAADAIIYYVGNNNVNQLMVNVINTPLLFQLPSINQLQDQRCAWIPTLSLALHGINLSYLRRFDLNRNTVLYFIIGIASLTICALIQLMLFVVIPITFPFGLIASPIPFLCVCLYAHRRNQIRTLWEGNFVDLQFAHRSYNIDLEIILGKKKSDLSKFTQIIQNLKWKQPSINQNQSSINSNQLRQSKGNPIKINIQEGQ